MRAAFAVALAAWLSALPAAAAAAEWTVDRGASSIEFEVVVNGYPSRGELPAFQGSGSFDPAAPEQSQFEVVIDMAQVEMGDPIATSLARSFDWFHVEEHPEAVFRLDRLAPRGDGAYVASGTLKLRGVEHAFEAPLAMSLEERRARATGEAVIDRRDYGVGQGPSSFFVQVDDRIVVRFDIAGQVAAAEAVQATQ